MGHVELPAIPVRRAAVQSDDGNAEIRIEANRNCPMFNANTIGPSPVGTTPTGPTPDSYGGVGYGAMLPPDTGAGAGTSFKIRLGTGNRG